MISVIMLTYNREKLVGRAIKSVLAQTYSDFEYIIVDNGSEDRSGHIANEYAALDQRIRVIHRERGTIGAGRNTGLGAANGEYITFIDDDDWVEPDFLEFLLALAEENAADIAICGTESRNYNAKALLSAEEALIELMWRKKYTAGFPMKLFAVQLMEGLRFSETDHYDDIGLIYQLFARATTVAYHGLSKYHVLRHDKNNSAWTTDHRLLSPQTLEEYLRAYRERTSWLSERFPGRAAAFRYFEWSFMISMVEKIHRLGLESCGKQLRAMEEELWAHREAFLNSPELLDFERAWMDLYISGPKESRCGA